jgi:hypothetical protein
VRFSKSLMKLRLQFALCVALVSCFTAAAQDIDLIGNVGWIKNGSRIRIEAQQIHNNTAFRSGLLRLQIWATLEPYDGISDIVGYVIGSARLPRLSAGDDRFDVVKRVRYRRPPAGYYYTTITLEERQGSDWFIIDSENFTDGGGSPSLVNLGGYGEGFVTLDSNGENNLTFFGDVSWLVGNGRAQFTAQEIRNERPSGISGVLRVRLFASTNGYTPGQVFYAYPLATKRVGRLPAQSQTQFVPRTTTYRAPPPGEWYITITLEEYNRGWTIVDYYNFQDLRVF